MKKLFLLALLMFAVAALAACSSDDEPAERRTLVMGTNAAFFPFEFVADHGRGVIGQYAGIDVSLVARIAEELDIDIVIQDQEFIGLIAALQNREIDFIAAAMTIRPDRAEQVNFTVPYFNAGQYIVVRSDNDAINSIADMEGMIVGVQFATTGDIAMTDANNEGIIDLHSVAQYNQPVAAIMDLLSGSIDAVVIDAPVARGFIAQHPGELRAFADPNEFFGPEQFGMAFHLEDTELLAEFNEVLIRLIEEGYVMYLYEYYNREFAPVE